MNDLLKSINIRLNNAFILSFVISWIFWNWPIVIGLLWYNAKTLELYGYVNYKELIIDNADVWKNYILPLCFAIAYPYLKLAFSALQTTVNAIDERTTKRLSGKGYISTQKFLDLRDQYETNIQKLSDVISKESEVINENMNLRTTLTELETANTLLKEKESDLRYSNDKRLLAVSSRRIFSGRWVLSLTSSEGVDVYTDLVFNDVIEDGGYIIGDYVGRKGRMMISSYVFNPYSRRVALHFRIDDQKKQLHKDSYGESMFSFGNLSWNNDYTILKGGESISFNELTFEMRKIISA